MQLACATDRDEGPVLFFDPALGHRRAVTVDLPVERRQVGPGAHLTLYVDVQVVDVGRRRRTSDYRCVCDTRSTTSLSLTVSIITIVEQ